MLTIYRRIRLILSVESRDGHGTVTSLLCVNTLFILLNLFCNYAVNMNLHKKKIEFCYYTRSWKSTCSLSFVGIVVYTLKYSSTQIYPTKTVSMLLHAVIILGLKVRFIVTIYHLEHRFAGNSEIRRLTKLFWTALHDYVDYIKSQWKTKVCCLNIGNFTVMNVHSLFGKYWRHLSRYFYSFNRNRRKRVKRQINK